MSATTEVPVIVHSDGVPVETVGQYAFAGFDDYIHVWIGGELFVLVCTSHSQTYLRKIEKFDVKDAHGFFKTGAERNMLEHKGHTYPDDETYITWLDTMYDKILLVFHYEYEGTHLQEYYLLEEFEDYAEYFEIDEMEDLEVPDVVKENPVSCMYASITDPEKSYWDENFLDTGRKVLICNGHDPNDEFPEFKNERYAVFHDTDAETLREVLSVDEDWNFVSKNVELA